ncbi:MAG: hypothetical protein JNL80_01445 [Phycisphaerae bacterium]|jgi:hypothetical protein|nr:hypothetical protein [Phycisphaerae bacterium]
MSLRRMGSISVACIMAVAVAVAVWTLANATRAKPSEFSSFQAFDASLSSANRAVLRVAGRDIELQATELIGLKVSLTQARTPLVDLGSRAGLAHTLTFFRGDDAIVTLHIAWEEPFQYWVNSDAAFTCAEADALLAAVRSAS